MAQKYNPSTGLWEDDEEQDSLSSSSSGVAFGGAPDIGTQQMPTSSSSTIPWQGAQIGLGDLYTQYDIPNSPGKYGIRDKSGNEMGFGYKPWDEAIADFAYYRGRTGKEGAWSHQALIPQDYGGYTSGYSGFGSNVDETGAPLGYAGGAPAASPYFGTEAELRAALNAGGHLTLENKEKYRADPSRAISNLQKSEMLGQFLTNPGQQTINDWTYHRDFGVNDNTPQTIAGENALYGGSTPVFKNGKLIGYQVDVTPLSGSEYGYQNPYTQGAADTSGRVTSSQYLSRNYGDSKNSAYDMGDGNAFVPLDKVPDFAGWTNIDKSTYHKESSGFGSFLKIALPIALMAAGGLGAAGMFGEAAGAAGGLTAGEMAAATGFSDLASMGAAGGAWGGFGGAAAGGLGSLAEAASNFGWSDAATGGMNAAFDGFGAGANNLASGLSSLFDTSGFSGADFIGKGNSFNALDSAFNGAGSALDASTPSSWMNVADVYSGPGPLTSPSSVVEGVDPFATTDAVNKDFSKLTGYGLNDPYGKGITGLPTGTEGEIKNMWNTMTQPMGGAAKGPSPLDALYKGGKAFMDYRANQDAMDMYKKQMALAQAGADPNRARGNTANDLWTQNWQNPQAGMAEFMGGAGRKFVDQARAQAAQGGRRGSYLNSGKMNSDLASLYLQNQNARGNALSQGFERPTNTNAQILGSMSPLMEMERNKYAPFGQAIDYIRRGSDLASGAKGLKDMYDTVSGWF